MKCLKNKLKDGSYEYLRVTEKEAMELVDSEDSNWKYISKEEFKTRSKYYKFIPSNGTWIKFKEQDENGEVRYVYRLKNGLTSKFNTKLYPNSSKIAKSSKNNVMVRRKGKYNSKNLTLFEVYKLPLWKFMEEDETNEIMLKTIGGRTVLGHRKNEFIKTFNRILS